MKKRTTKISNLFNPIKGLIWGMMMLIYIGNSEAQTLNDLLPIPDDFKQYNASIPHGMLQTVTYHSNTTGGNRKAMVYTPPGYSSSIKYNVFYCLHGINGNEREWNGYTDPDYIMDNLVAKGKVSPMIVVFPNATLDAFESDLLNDLIPYIQANFSVATASVNRALAGYSWGGGQSLNIGLGNLGRFDYVGGLSSAPNTRSATQLVPNPSTTNSRIKVLYLSCGTEDGLLSITQNLVNNFKSRNVNHIAYIRPGEHNILPWERDFYLFTQMIFKNTGTPPQTLEGTYRITARHSGKVLDVNAAGTANGTTVIQWANTGGTNQQWIISSVGNGYYRISPKHAPGKALDVNNASTADGGTVDIWDYVDVAQEQWQFVDLGNGYYNIKARNSGKCLDVNANSTANGAKVQIWTCANVNNQQWSLTKLASTSREVASLEDAADAHTKISILPNPSNGSFKVESDRKGLLQIFDRNGKLLLSKNLDDRSTDIDSGLSSGIYIVKVTVQGNVATSRLVVR